MEQRSFKELLLIALFSKKHRSDRLAFKEALETADVFAVEVCQKWGHDHYNEYKCCRRCGAKDLLPYR